MHAAKLEVQQREKIERTRPLRELISIIQVTIETIDQSAFPDDIELKQFKHELTSLQKIIATDITYINQATRPNYCDPYGTSKLRLEIINKTEDVRKRITSLETTGTLDRDSSSPRCIPDLFNEARPRRSSINGPLPIKQKPALAHQKLSLAKTL